MRTLPLWWLVLMACTPTMRSSSPVETRADVTLTRLDCGGPTTEKLAIFSDAHAFDGLTGALVGSCYLITHGGEYLVWDTGVDLAEKDEHGQLYTRRSLVEQLAALGLNADQITWVGISHVHEDHLGQAASFPKATLLLGSADWAAISEPADEPNARRFLAPWVTGNGKKLTVDGDRDVFGDGSVVMLATPGHTRGHHSLLVRLRQTGNLILSGDAAIFREGFERREVPPFNTSRAESLASLDRLDRLLANLRATLIIQHDARDVAKLPAFPAQAR